MDLLHSVRINVALDIIELILYSRIKKAKIKWSRFRPGVVQRLGRGIALLFQDRDTRRGWVVSVTPLPHFTRGKETVPILQEVACVPGRVWTGGKSRPHRDSIPHRPACSSVDILTQLPPPHIIILFYIVDKIIIKTTREKQGRVVRSKMEGSGKKEYL